MLEQCFCHLPGIGEGIEKKLKKAGICTWDDAEKAFLPFGPSRREAFLSGLEESKRRLEAGDAYWFSSALPPSRQWMLFPHFKHSVAYVDIETTGVSWPEDFITCIALYDGQKVKTYVRGYNLEDFADDILEYSLLVTWNGRGFDAPILRRTFNIPLDKGNMGHLDLLPVFRTMGMHGGLKKVEKMLGLDRNELDGVDGLAAIWLWREFDLTGDERYLQTLLAYNVADVLSLEYLAHYALNHFTGAGDEAPLPQIRTDLNPHTADNSIVKELPTRSGFNW